MGKIYVLSSSDLLNHAVIFDTKEEVNLSQIKKIVGFEKLEIEYETDFTGFPISEYKGYLGFDESTNDMLSIYPEPYIGYINTKFSEYKTLFSPFIFKISTEEASLKIANDYHNNYSVSKRISRKINKLIKEKNKEKSDWDSWLSLMKEKGRNEVKQLDDKFWKKHTAESEIKIKEFYEKNPYIRIKKPTGIGGLLMKIKLVDEKEIKRLEDENWKKHVIKCRNYIDSLIPDDEKLSEIILPCLVCKTEKLPYQPKFSDFKNDVIINGVVLDDISTNVSLLNTYCQKCKSNIQIPLNVKSQIFPKSNHYRWNSIWWLRFRFWGDY